MELNVNEIGKNIDATIINNGVEELEAVLPVLANIITDVRALILSGGYKDNEDTFNKLIGLTNITLRTTALAMGTDLDAMTMPVLEDFKKIEGA